MPNPVEICEVAVGGQRLRDWDSVRVECDYSTVARIAVVTIAEKSGGDTSRYFSALKVKTGDPAQVTLAGQKVIDGFIIQRQASYNATSHGVQITVYSKAIDLVHSSAPVKASQYRGYPFKSVAEKLLEPYGIELKIENPGPDIGKAFRDLNFWPGESTFAVLDRLARQRGMYLRSDEDGNVVAGRMGEGGSGADLEEGRNIRAASCVFDDTSLKSRVDALGQQRGDDQIWGEDARKPAAFSTNSDAKRHKPLIFVSEEPGDAKDMQARADHEMNERLGEIIQAVITVQGWLKAGGDLWKEGEQVKVKSPMLPLDNDMWVQTVAFSQDNENGTLTALTLRNRPMGKLDGLSPSDPSALPGDGAQPAEPST